MFPEIPGFTITKALGEGAMAKVYLATDEALDRRVALKVMNESLAHDPEFRDRFINEAKDTAKFNHEGIVKIFTTGVHGDHYFLALEYLEAGTLKDNLKSRKKQIEEGGSGTGFLYSGPEALLLLKSLAQALSYAHDKHVVHRDIKPENILFRSDGHAVLSDFGIAKSVDTDKNLTMAGYRVGTPAYMSPEQMLGAQVDPRSDIYSLGVVFYEIMVGHRPYKTNVSEYSELIKQLDEPVPDLAPDLAYLQPLLQIMLAKRPDERAQSAQEVLRLISQISKQSSTGHADGTVIQPVVKGPAKAASISGSKSGSKPLLKWGAVAVIAIIIAAVATTTLMKPVEPEKAPVVVQPVDSETAKQIVDLLESAKTYLEFDFVISPPVSNAAETYSRVLEMQPGNPDAIAGMQKAAGVLITQIEGEIEAGNPNSVMGMLELGLHFFPDNKKLTDLQKQVSQP